MNQLHTKEAIREWLFDRLSTSLKVARASLDPDAPFSRYGLDSLGAITLVMDLEEQLDMELPPTLLWDHPTINRCAAHLVTIGCEAARLDQ